MAKALVISYCCWANCRDSKVEGVAISNISKLSAWSYPSPIFFYEHCEDWPDCKVLKPLHEVILTDMSINLGLLVVCLAAYVVTYVAVIIVRWVISGFKKEN